MKLSVRCLHSPVIGGETIHFFIPVLPDAFFGVSSISRYTHLIAFDLPLRRRLLFLLVVLRAIWYGQRSTDRRLSFIFIFLLTSTCRILVLHRLCSAYKNPVSGFI